MLSLRPLDPTQYRQVAEWEYGPQPENMDWARYAAEMDAPQWEHLALYSGPVFVGCVSLEYDRQTTAFHVVTDRRKVHPAALADILLQIAALLFKRGFTAMVARIPKEIRAGARLARRCGMREYGHTPTMRHFILTESRYRRHGRFEA